MSPALVSPALISPAEADPTDLTVPAGRDEDPPEPADVPLAAQERTRRVVVGAARRYRSEHGTLPNWWVRRGAKLLSVSDRHFRRLVDHDPHPRKPFVPSDEHMERLYAAHGSMAKAHERCLNDEVADTPLKYRTFARGFAERADRSLVAGARDGWAGIRSTRASNTRHIAHRTQSYAIDHRLCDVLVRDDDGGNPLLPWETTVIDECTRFELMVATSPTAPDTTTTVGALALAVEGWTTEEGLFIGGMPDQVLSDNGGDLRSHPATVGLIRLGVVRRFTTPGESQLNGRVERKQGSVNHVFTTTLPGYIPPHLKSYDRKRLLQEWSLRPNQLLTLEQYGQLRLDESRRYNFERIHGSLRGKTPFEAWQADPADIARADPEAVRLAMLASAFRVVDHGTVRIFGERYYPEYDEGGVDLDAYAGRKVEVRYMPGHTEVVYLFADGLFVCKCRARSDGGGNDQHTLQSRRDRRTAQFLKLSSGGQKLQAEWAREQLGEGVLEHAKPQLPPEGDTVHREKVPGGRHPRGAAAQASAGRREPSAPTVDPRYEEVDAYIRDYQEQVPF